MTKDEIKSKIHFVLAILRKNEIEYQVADWNNGCVKVYTKYARTMLIYYCTTGTIVGKKCKGIHSLVALCDDVEYRPICMM